MLDKLRDNPRAVVAALVAAGVLAVAVGASGNGNNNSPETSSTPSVEVSQEDQTNEEQVEGQPEQEESAQNTEPSEPTNQPSPSAEPVSISNDQGTLSATVRKGDNQTVIVRQMIADYLASNNESLSGEQRLYTETILVSKLPRNDRIFAGETIALNESMVAETVTASKSLDQAAIARWSKYL